MLCLKLAKQLLLARSKGNGPGSETRDQRPGAKGRTPKASVPPTALEKGSLQAMLIWFNSFAPLITGTCKSKNGFADTLNKKLDRLETDYEAYLAS